MAFLFEQLPADINEIICSFISALDLDHEQLGSLRFVSKAWRQAVEDGSLGMAGLVHAAGLHKFACRVSKGLPRESYPALGILNKDGTKLHVHPLMTGHFGKGSSSLGDAQSSETWIDIPESTVIIGQTLYVLSEPKLPWGALDRVKQLRMRSYELGQEDAGWHEKASLHFGEEEAPLSPAAECFVVDVRYGVATSSLKVVASKRYIFILHFSVSQPTPREYPIVNAVHGSLYDTQKDTWRVFPLPEGFSRKFTGQLHYENARRGDFRCTASSNYVCIQSYWDLYVHSLKGDELERSWQLDTLMMKGEVRSCFDLLIIPEPAAGVDELSVLRLNEEDFETYDITVFTFKLASEAQDSEDCTLLKLLRLSVLEETGWKKPSGILYCIKALQLLDGEPLILDKSGGTWPKTAKRIQYHYADAVTEARKEVLCWSRFLPLF